MTNDMNCGDGKFCSIAIGDVFEKANVRPMVLDALGNRALFFVRGDVDVDGSWMEGDGERLSKWVGNSVLRRSPEGVEFANAKGLVKLMWLYGMNDSAYDVFIPSEIMPDGIPPSFKYIYNAVSRIGFDPDDFSCRFGKFMDCRLDADNVSDYVVMGDCVARFDDVEPYRKTDWTYALGGRRQIDLDGKPRVDMIALLIP